MSEETKDNTIETHKKFAVELFNRAWELHDKVDRSVDETDEMLNTAHASAYHWLMLKDRIDETRWMQSAPRSHNQLANVYISTGRSEPALYHAIRSLELCKERGIGDFDLAFGYECLARAHHLAGTDAERNENLKLAIEAGEAIGKDEDKQFFLQTLEKAPGFAEVRG